MNRFKLKGREVWIFQYKWNNDGDDGQSAKLFEKEKDVKKWLLDSFKEDMAENCIEECEDNEGECYNKWGSGYWINKDYVLIDACYYKIPIK